MDLPPPGSEPRLRLDETTPSTPRYRGETERAGGPARPTLRDEVETPRRAPPTVTGRSLPVGGRRLVPILLVVVGLVVLVAGAVVHSQSGGSSTATTEATGGRDVLTVSGRQSYVLPASRLTANDPGSGLRVLGLAARGDLHGRLTLDRTHQQLLYRPDLSFSGSVRFTYRATDDSGTHLTGNAVLQVVGFDRSAIALLAYVPTSVRASCSAAAKPAGGTASLRCSAPPGILTFEGFASSAAAGKALRRTFTARAGSCAKNPGTGSWAFAGSNRVARGSFGCKVGSGARPLFGWTYPSRRYLAVVRGAPHASLGSLTRWFYSLRLGR
jgi:hypothetical protein